MWNNGCFGYSKRQFSYCCIRWRFSSSDCKVYSICLCFVFCLFSFSPFFKKKSYLFHIACLFCVFFFFLLHRRDQVGQSITDPHLPNREDERNRIIEAGGWSVIDYFSLKLLREARKKKTEMIILGFHFRVTIQSYMSPNHFHRSSSEARESLLPRMFSSIVSLF